MSTDSGALRDTLAEHADGLRRLVRGLVYSDAEAEDVVQDTLLAAVRRQSAPANWGAWLTRVARNQASNLRRAEGRRTRRERSAARPERRPAADELVARLEEKQRLLACLRSLETPYRETLILRFFEDLPPRAIALRRNVPVSTVKTHLQRGLLRLRKQLDGAHGGRRGRWQAALLPLAGAPGDRSLLVTALGWTAMKKIAVALTGAALLLAVGWSAKELLTSEDEPPKERASSEAVAPQQDAPAGADDTAPHLAVREAEAALPVPLPDPARATKENSIHGRVVDLEGKPVPGALVTAMSDADPWAPLDLTTMRSETDVDGSYLAGPIAEGVITVTARGKGLASITRTVPARGARIDFVMEPAFEVALAVRDSRGAPVAGARVVYTARGDSLTHKHEISGTTDAEGTIRIVGVLDEPGSIWVRSPQHGAYHSSVRKSMFWREGGGTWTTMTLRDRTEVGGIVVDKATGAPITGAVVSVGWGHPHSLLRTDADGRFATRTAVRAAPRPPVRVHALGYRATHVTFDAPTGGGPATVRVELERAAPLRGIVRAPGGKPVPDARVQVTALRIHHDLDTRTDAEGRFALAQPQYRGPRFSGPMPEEQIARIRAKQHIPLAARHPDLGVGVAAPRLPELSSEIEIRLTGVGDVTGTVRTPDGKPAVGAIVRLEPQWSESRSVVTDADRLQSHLWAALARPSAVADARGMFRVRGLPAATYRAEARLGDELLVGIERGVRVEHGGTQEISLTLGDDLTIRGRIVDQQGTPIPGVVILAVLDEIDVMPATHSRSDGSFIIPDLSPGTYTLMLEGPNMHLEQQPVIVAGAQDVVIRVERSIPVMILVTQDGRPYARRFTVEVIDAEKPAPVDAPLPDIAPFRVQMEAWGPKGECKVTGLPPGAYRVRVSTKDGLRSEEDALVTLTAGVTPDDVRVELKRP